MNKQNLLFLTLLTALSLSTLEARQFFQPSPLSYGYAYSHYPFLPPIDENECNKCAWFDMINPWMAAEFRHANRAFLNKDGTRTNSLAGLFFDQESFTIANIVSPGSTSPLFPLASIINITPDFDYTEHVAWFGLNLEKRFGCDEEWHVGLRLRIPFRDIKTELDSCCDLETNFNDLFVAGQNELVCNDGDDPNNLPRTLINAAFAYRLDFLSALPLAVNSTTKFVQYADPNNGNKITMAGIDVTDFNGNPINVVSVPVGQKPATPFTLRLNDRAASVECPDTAGESFVGVAQQGLPFLNGTGTNAPAGTRAKFEQTADLYVPLGANVAQQRTLWVVPTATSLPSADGVGTVPFAIVQPARAIQSAFNAIVEGASAIDFLASATGINFNTQRRSGPGDFLTELYVHRDFCGCWGEWFAEGIFGATFPTAHRNNFPNLVLLQPVGNNRHFEVKIGGFLGWKPFDWMAIKVDGFYNWALSRNERVAASFAGATVRNIGPAIDGKVSWQYFVGDVDITFMVPCVCPELGVDVGYQPYVKRSDKVKFAQTTAVDLLGNVNTLDANVLETRTKQVAHTIKGEIFYQACSWQLFGGFNHAVAGKNAPKLSAWYLGAEVYF